MEPQGRPGMQGVFGILLIAGGMLLIFLVLRDLAGFGSAPTATVTLPGGGTTTVHAPYVPPNADGSCPTGYTNILGTCRYLQP